MTDTIKRRTGPTAGRRTLLKGTAAAAATVAMPGVLRHARAQGERITFWQYKNPPGSAAMLYYAAAADRFQSATGVQVDIEFKSAEGIEQAVAAAANAGEGFDAMLWWGGPTARNQASLGNVVALGDRFSDEFWSHRQGAATMRYQGQQYGVPFDVSPWFMLYNRSVLADAGVDPDIFPPPTEAPIEWGAFLDVVAKVKASGAAPLAWANQQGYFNEWYFYNFEGQSFDDPQSIIDINLGEGSWQNQAVHDALGAYRELYQAGAFVEGGEVVPYEQHVRQLASGQAAMCVYFDMSGATSATIDVYGVENVGFTKVPAYRRDTALFDYICQEPNALYVASFSSKQDAAVAWLEHLTSVDEMNAFAAATQQGPADDRWDLDNISNPAIRAVFEGASAKGHPYPYNFVTQAQYTSLLEDGILYLRGDMSAEEITAKWDEVDAEYKEQQGG
ncbi:MAG: extracellular solute-binding protein [Azospirillaceae bacterium]